MPPLQRSLARCNNNNNQLTLSSSLCNARSLSLAVSGKMPEAGAGNGAGDCAGNGAGARRSRQLRGGFATFRRPHLTCELRAASFVFGGVPFSTGLASRFGQLVPGVRQQPHFFKRESPETRFPIFWNFLGGHFRRKLYLWGQFCFFWFLWLFMAFWSSAHGGVLINGYAHE